jgi:hypothetical protein
MGVAEENWEGVALAGAHRISASQADDFMSEAGPEGSDELTWLSCSAGTSFGAVAIFPPLGATGAVRKDRLSPSIRRRTTNICSLLHSFVSFIHADLADFCCVAQLDSSSMGAVGREPSRFRCREHGLAFFDWATTGRDEDGVVGKGALCSWGVHVVIGTVAVVGGRTTAVTGGELDDDV